MSNPSKILCIAAHPDDLDFGASGTISAWTKSGIEVIYCIVTDGDAGGEDREMSRRDMAQLRQKEQRDAAAKVGVDTVHFLSYPDGRLTCSIELRKDLSRMIRQVKPDRVLAPSPDRAWERIFASHPDHLAVGEATVFAIYPDARNPFAHPELLNDENLEPHTVNDLWLMASPFSFNGPTMSGAEIANLNPSYDPVDPTSLPCSQGTWVCACDITSTFTNKIEALKAHASQTSHIENLETVMKMWLQSSSIKYGLPEGHLAEVFQRVTSL